MNCYSLFKTQINTQLKQLYLIPNPTVKIAYTDNIIKSKKTTLYKRFKVLNILYLSITMKYTVIFCS